MQAAEMHQFGSMNFLRTRFRIANRLRRWRLTYIMFSGQFSFLSAIRNSMMSFVPKVCCCLLHLTHASKDCNFQVNFRDRLLRGYRAVFCIVKRDTDGFFNNVSHSLVRKFLTCIVHCWNTEVESRRPCIAIPWCWLPTLCQI